MFHAELMTTVGRSSPQYIGQHENARTIIEPSDGVKRHPVDIAYVLIRLDIDRLDTFLFALEQMHGGSHECFCQWLMHEKEYAYHNLNEWDKSKYRLPATDLFRHFSEFSPSVKPLFPVHP